MKRYCLTLDLKNDKNSIEAYEKYHKNVWPEIQKSIIDAGIEHMEIYRWETRLFMIMEVNDHFSFEKKKSMDASNPKVQEWESLMGKFQQGLPGAKEGEKWQLMRKIFILE